MSHSPSLTSATSSTRPRTGQGGTWRMLLAMALSGTIGLLVVESALPPLLVVFARCVLGALAWACGWPGGANGSPLKAVNGCGWPGAASPWY